MESWQTLFVHVKVFHFIAVQKVAGLALYVPTVQQQPSAEVQSKTIKLQDLLLCAMLFLCFGARAATVVGFFGLPVATSTDANLLFDAVNDGHLDVAWRTLRFQVTQHLLPFPCWSTFGFFSN